MDVELDTTAVSKGISLPAYLWDWVENVAAMEQRTVSNMIRLIVVRYLERGEGYGDECDEES